MEDVSGAVLLRPMPKGWASGGVVEEGCFGPQEGRKAGRHGRGRDSNAHGGQSQL